MEKNRVTTENSEISKDLEIFLLDTHINVQKLLFELLSHNLSKTEDPKKAHFLEMLKIFSQNVLGGKGFPNFQVDNLMKKLAVFKVEANSIKINLDHDYLNNLFEQKSFSLLERKVFFLIVYSHELGHSIQRFFYDRYEDKLNRGFEENFAIFFSTLFFSIIKNNILENFDFKNVMAKIFLVISILLKKGENPCTTDGDYRTIEGHPSPENYLKILMAGILYGSTTKPFFDNLLLSLVDEKHIPKLINTPDL